jgi:mono/diheme cytochrome c family protein
MKRARTRRAGSAFAARAAMSLASAMVLSSAGCSGEESGGSTGAEQAPPAAQKPAAPAKPAAGPSAEDARAEAMRVFEQRCVTCHGPEGKGDGPGSVALTPKPRNFHDAEWQDSVTDEHIEQIIMYGGAAVGKSPMMPANPDLVSKPEIVAALRAHVRSLGAK